jgi:hypothetical protein
MRDEVADGAAAGADIGKDMVVEHGELATGGIAEAPNPEALPECVEHDLLLKRNRAKHGCSQNGSCVSNLGLRAVRRTSFIVR